MAKEQNNQESPLAHFDPNAAAALSYLVPPITGIAIFILEKKNTFVRFHAFQSILFGIGMYVLHVIVRSFRFFFIADVMSPIIGLALFAGWLFLMWEAYNNREYEIPYLGQIAKEQAKKI